MLYSLLRRCLFTLDPETAHHLTLSLLPIVTACHFFKTTHKHSVNCMGLTFPNPIGLAAGLDKDGVALSAWPRLGFGFMEIGTVTPKPQPGNPKPRLFRLTEDKAIINRMGFNNEGVESLTNRLKNFKHTCPLGINIGKNKDTELASAHSDYTKAFEAVYPYADYVTVNISSPNTPGLRELQGSEHIDIMMQAMITTRERLQNNTARQVPIAVKISPDLNEAELQQTIEALMRWKVDAIIATNTTLARPTTLKSKYKIETGGLSGAPLFEPSTQQIKHIAAITAKTIPIIAVGGIMNAEQAQQKFSAGATLIQLYTGFIYQGPRLIKEILHKL